MPQLTTEEFDGKLEELRKLLGDSLRVQQQERHNHNAKLHGVLLELSGRTLSADQTMERVGRSLDSMATNVANIDRRMGQLEERLVGNDALKSTGLVDTVAKATADIATLQKAHETIATELTVAKRALGWIKGLLFAGGGILAWIKILELVAWLKGTP